ncbi:MAG: hypothetical protein GY798_33760 [Hyphomicrobiales bacterium]|nr:hypothetical protein [Hyphomicrobiales bacterium]
MDSRADLHPGVPVNDRRTDWKTEHLKRWISISIAAALWQPCGNFHPNSPAEFPNVAARITLAIHICIILFAVWIGSFLPLMLVGILPTIYGAWLGVYVGFTQHAGLAEDVLDHRLTHRASAPPAPRRAPAGAEKAGGLPLGSGSKQFKDESTLSQSTAQSDPPEFRGRLPLPGKRATSAPGGRGGRQGRRATHNPARRVKGPVPADTVFVRALKGEFDAVMTMFHDQGQIAMIATFSFKRRLCGQAPVLHPPLVLREGGGPGSFPLLDLRLRGDERF